MKKKIMELEPLFLSLPVTCHTDFINKGSTFVAIQGAKLNGNDYIIDAIKKGASKIIIQKDSILSNETINLIKLNNVQLHEVKDCRLELTKLSSQAWNYPNKKLKILGVTGTKGKTTSVFLLNHILSCAGYKTAMISGVFNLINNKKYASNLTTPQPDYLYAFLNKCVQENVEYVIMESSAQAFSLKRLYGIEFDGAIFTNLDLEHTEFYASMNDYFQAKKEILNQLKSNAPLIVNIDNTWGQKLALENKNIYTYGFNKNSEFYIKIKKNDLSGLQLKINELDFYSNLIGDFNAYNIAGVVALSLKLGLKYNDIMCNLKTFNHVPGRMEMYKLKNGALAVIDYAHNPSSFNYVLPTIKSIANKLIVVFGAGGEKDKLKRPIMGNIASTIADKVVVTSDNPRSENVEDIIAQIASGISSQNINKVICQIDRAKAIEQAYKLSNKNDVIAILGKGPDEYEMIGNEKRFFSDKETILSCN